MSPQEMERIIYITCREFKSKSIDKSVKLSNGNWGSSSQKVKQLFWFSGKEENIRIRLRYSLFWKVSHPWLQWGGKGDIDLFPPSDFWGGKFIDCLKSGKYLYYRHIYKVVSEVKHVEYLSKGVATTNWGNSCEEAGGYWRQEDTRGSRG